MINCIVVDDEPHAIDILKLYIHKVPSLVLTFSTTNAIEAFEYVQKNKTDLIFLDIQMPELNGLQFLKLLNGRSKVILTTAYREHALEGFEYEVLDYLLKPVLFDRFLKSIRKYTDTIATPVSSIHIQSSTTEPASDFLFVKTGTRNKLVKIEHQHIEYIESKGNYVSFVLSQGQVTTLISLKELEKELPAKAFLRIHSGYIVAKNKITGLEGNTLFIGTIRLPIGETYKKAVQLFFNEYIIQKNNPKP